jgi:hypothetical protein
MKNNFIQEIIVATILIILLILLVNPFGFWMPDMVHMMMLAAALVVFAVFAAFILREKVTDERDSVHRMLAGRSAFLAGSTVLVVAICIQSFNHSIDIWLVFTLIVMILAKIGARVYSDRNF